jgi:hypothetical protein
MATFGVKTLRRLCGLAALLLASSCGQRDGSDVKVDEPAVAGSYAPADAIAASWGAFDYYRTHATFAAFQGHLSLEDAGRMPASAGEELAGAQVFKIVNAEEHFAANRSREGACLTAPRWLAIKALKEELGEKRVRVALLMLENFGAFVPGKPGFCGAGIYANT